jgi:hypothetical protein
MLSHGMGGSGWLMRRDARRSRRRRAAVANEDLDKQWKEDGESDAHDDADDDDVSRVSLETESGRARSPLGNGGFVVVSVSDTSDDACAGGGIRRGLVHVRRVEIWIETIWTEDPADVCQRCRHRRLRRQRHCDIRQQQQKTNGTRAQKVGFSCHRTIPSHLFHYLPLKKLVLCTGRCESSQCRVRRFPNVDRIFHLSPPED